MFENVAIALNQEWAKKKAVDSVIRYDARRVRDAYMSHLLPHMGVMAHDNNTKMRFLGE